MAAVQPLLRQRPITSVQGTLALDLAPEIDPTAPFAVPGSRESGLRHRLEGWSRKYAQAVADVVAGARPASQIRLHTSPRVLRDLARRAQLLQHAHGDSGRRFPASRGHVVSTHVALVSDTAAEVSIRLRHGERSRAAAARFELNDENRWICVAYDFS